MTARLQRKDVPADVEAIIRQVSNSPLAMVNVASTLLLEKGLTDLAMDLSDQALARAPGDGEVRQIRAEVFSEDVGHWYVSTLRDAARHAAYDLALRRALAGGGRVLEIGVGTGLFAMMAARAGADEVISCERRPAVARAARAVVARNGLSDKITVVSKTSADLKIGVDMDGPADVLIWDNLTNSLIGAGALEAIEDAMRRLVRPGGQVIPAGCAIRAALAEDRELDGRRLGQVEGFDLSPFNSFARPAYTLDTASPELTIRSSETTLFDFDFGSGGPFPAARTSGRVIGTGGRANGIVQWLEFTLDEHQVYRPGPGVEAWAFGLEFHPLVAPFEAPQGAPFTIKASHDRDRLRVWLGDG